MNTDNLDQPPDAELSEVFAVEVAGYKRFLDPACGFIWKDAEGAVVIPRVRQRFATSADAVLPYIDALGWAEVNQWNQRDGKPTNERAWRVRVMARGSYIEGTAPTFARAACIALLRATRAEKGQP